MAYPKFCINFALVLAGMGLGLGLGLGGILVSSNPSFAITADENWINEKLKQFQQDPKKFMHDPANVQKVDPDTLYPIAVHRRFSEEAIQNFEFLRSKGELRNSIPRFRAIKGRAGMIENDRPENLVDQLLYKTPKEMEEAGLTSAQLKDEPWSGYYWALYQGSVANRYTDSHFPKDNNIDIITEYVNKPQVSSVNLLSPAEKYDLLVGDSKKTLTDTVLRNGASYAKSNDDRSIEKWMGICHGWAPAAYMYPRPARALKLTAADGVTQISFYPDDIKALASLLWANAQPDVRFIGGRCNNKTPKEDENGRTTDPDCFDTNPGTWHLSVVNQIGAAKRSFVMDASYDYEVWNQPIYSYEYSYYNPQTLKAVKTLAEATVLKSDFTADKFPTWRSPEGKSIVGIVMKLVYIAETQPIKSTADSPTDDRRVAVRYLYDLELNAKGEIIGGEWRVNRHPDFLWTPAPNARALSVGDGYLRDSSWDSSTHPLPASWLKAARFASSKMQPLTAVMDELVQASNAAEMTTRERTTVAPSPQPTPLR